MLPPIGQISADDTQDVASYLVGLAQEAREARQPWERMVADNIQIYLWGELIGSDESPGVTDPNRIIVNEIQNAIIAATDIQTKDPPSATLEPVETGEPPLYYWGGPQEIGLAIGLLPFEVADFTDEQTGETKPPVPLDPLVAGQLKAMAIPEEVSPALPPGMIRPEWLVELNDKLVADVYQSVFDVVWARSGTDLWVRESLNDTNIQGWAWGLYEFNDTEKRHVLRHLPINQVYIDPVVRDISRASYAGYDLPIDADEAKAMFPHLADVIDENAGEGMPAWPDAASGTWSSIYQRNFRRPMVVFRRFWIRNQVVPFTHEEATAHGAVISQPDPTDPQQQILIDPETGNVVKPGDTANGWPTRLGVRQITQLGATIVDDREAEFADIPLLHNVNIPVPGERPWGLGEPFRLYSLQQAESNILDAMVKHVGYYKSPTGFMSESMHALLPEEQRDMYARPGKQYIMPDEQYAACGGKPTMFQDPPAMPPALGDLLPQVKQMINEQSGHAEVLQGRAQSQVKSGKAIELLQSAASSMIGFKSQRTGDMVKRLADLMLHSLVFRLEVPDIAQIVSKYPPHVLASICQRARQIEWDVSVKVQAGSGEIQSQKRQLAMMDLQAGAISLKTYWEQCGIDGRQEEARLANQQQRMAQQQMGMMPPPGAAPMPGGGAPPPPGPMGAPQGNPLAPTA